MASLRFSRDMLLNQSVAHAKLITACAPWGAYHLEDRVKLISNKDNKLFPPEYNDIPGHIGLSFSQAVLPALDNSPKSAGASDFQGWSKFQCTDSHMAGASGPTCHINPAFWVQNTSCALASLLFKSGQCITSKDDCQGGFLTSCLYLLSVGSVSALDIPKFLTAGLSSSQIIQLLCNMFFILHLVSRDTKLYPILGLYTMQHEMVLNADQTVNSIINPHGSKLFKLERLNVFLVSPGYDGTRLCISAPRRGSKKHDIAQPQSNGFNFFEK